VDPELPVTVRGQGRIKSFSYSQEAGADPELPVAVRGDRGGSRSFITRQREQGRIQTIQLQSEGALPIYKNIFGINKASVGQHT